MNQEQNDLQHACTEERPAAATCDPQGKSEHDQQKEVPIESGMPKSEQEGRHRCRHHRHGKRRDPASLAGTAQGEHRRNRLQHPGGSLIEADRLIEGRQHRSEEFRQNGNERNAVRQCDAGAPGDFKAPVDKETSWRTEVPSLSEEIDLPDHILAEVWTRRRTWGQRADESPLRKDPPHQRQADDQARQIGSKPGRP